MRNNHTAGTALMFLTGLAAGGAAALLFAPQTGKRTRRQITRKAEDARDYLEDLGEDLIERGRGLVEQSHKIARRRTKFIGAAEKILNQA